MPKKSYLAAIFVVMLAAITVYADTYGPEEPAADMSMVAGALASVNFGTDDPIAVGSVVVASWHSRSVLVFNITSIPQGSTVSNATLALNIAGVTGSPTTFKIKRLVPVPTSVGMTWNNYTTGTAWPGSAGASTSGTDFYAAEISTITAPSGTGSFTITSNSTFTAMIQDAVDLSIFRSARFVMVSDDEGALKSWSFNTKENATAGLRPKLTVEFTSPTTTSTVTTTSTSTTLVQQALIITE